MKDRISKLIDVKTIITLALTGAFIYLAIARLIPVESFMVIFGMVITFFFVKPKTTDTPEVK